MTKLKYNFRFHVGNSLTDLETYGNLFMTPTELAQMGFGLARQYVAEGDKYYFKDSNYDGNHALASELEKKANDILSIVGNPELRKKIENCPLSSNLAEFDSSYENFNLIYNTFAEFARSGQLWEVYFAASEKKILKIWEISKRLPQDKNISGGGIFFVEGFLHRIAKQEKQVAVRLAEEVAATKESLKKPARTAPCFEDARRNGLNCNRSDLIEIKKFPTRLKDEIKTDISIKICLQCRQLYKEVFEVDELNETYQNRFLKPGETDLRLGVNFSIGEVQEYAKIDFAQLVNPLLETENSVLESANPLPE